MLSFIQTLPTLGGLKSITSSFPLTAPLLAIFPQVGKIRKSAARKREFHILFMVLTTAACYLICWMPYGVVAMMATFGPPNIISPVASVVPSLLAKSSTVINPLIYILMNKQVSKLILITKQMFFKSTRWHVVLFTQ